MTDPHPLGAARRVIVLPERIIQPISWRSEPGLFGQKWWVLTSRGWRRSNYREIQENSFD